MGFMIHTIDDAKTAALEYLPCSAVTPKAGMAMTMENGKLAVAAGTTKPTYVCMTERENAAADGEIIPVARVRADITFETAFSEAASAVKPGDKVTVSEDGLFATATTDGGTAEIITLYGTAAGDPVRVRFS